MFNTQKMLLQNQVRFPSTSASLLFYYLAMEVAPALGELSAKMQLPWFPGGFGWAPRKQNRIGSTVRDPFQPGMEQSPSFSSW